MTLAVHLLLHCLEVVRILQSILITCVLCVWLHYNICWCITHVRNEKVIIATIRLNPKKNLHLLIATITDEEYGATEVSILICGPLDVFSFFLNASFCRRDLGIVRHVQRLSLLHLVSSLVDLDSGTILKRESLHHKRRHPTHFRCGRWCYYTINNEILV